MLRDETHNCRVEQYTVHGRSSALGRTLGDLRIRSRLGISVFCVLRREDKEMVFNPSASFEFEEGDVMVFIADPGTHRRLDRILDEDGSERAP
jgi:K+/H+ antiporter YhaU regulatory subunit KhtT